MIFILKRQCGIVLILVYFTLLIHVTSDACLLHKTGESVQCDSVLLVRSKRSATSAADLNDQSVRIDTEEDVTNCFEEPKLWCNTDSKYRSIDGRCNNLKWRTWGMANTALNRLAFAEYSDAFCALKTSKDESPPSASILANFILNSKRPQNLGNITKFIAMFACVIADDVSIIDLPKGDHCCSNKTELESQLGELACTCMATETFRPESQCPKTPRTKTTYHVQCPVFPVHQLTTVSSYLDASFLYTSDMETLNKTRTMSEGKLKMTTDSQGRPFPHFFKSPSDSGLSRFHSQSGSVVVASIFFRLHNFLCDILVWLNPSWSDEEVFQEARRILIAMYQHVVYYEFVPVIVGYEYSKKYDLMPTLKKQHENYDSKINPSTVNSFTTAAFRVFHSLFADSLSIEDKAGGGITKRVNLTASIFKDNIDLMAEDGYDEFISGALNQALSEANSSSASKFDLLVMDIERTRDHGLPLYNEFRQLCQLPEISDFDDLKNYMHHEDVLKLAELYEDVDDIELYVGGGLEYQNKDALVGPAFQCLIAEAFYRYKFGDRFFYEHDNIAGRFTKEQLEEIKKVTLSLIICISSNALSKVQSNVFYLPSNLNPEIFCEMLFKPDYSLWQERREK